MSLSIELFQKRAWVSASNANLMETTIATSLTPVSVMMNSATSISRSFQSAYISTTLPQAEANQNTGEVAYHVLAAVDLPRQVREGEHLDAKSLDELPYNHIKHLGMGGYGTVDMVKDVTSGRYFARKILRKRYDEDFASVKVQFLNEIRILRSFSLRRHVIRAFASYDFNTELALILEPIAECGSLAQFLSAIKSDEARPNDEDRTVLRQSFGCLTSTLAFIHQKQVRHKDVSPANILVHQNKMILSDFGIAMDCSMASTTTRGGYGAGNRRFSAPEVVAWNGARNRKSDIFSLGCVLVEIALVLQPDCIPLEGRSSVYSDRAESLSSRMAELAAVSSDTPPGVPRLAFEAMSRMLRPDASQRASAQEIFHLLCQDSSLFCKDCVDDLVASVHAANHANPSSGCSIVRTSSSDGLGRSDEVRGRY